MLQTSGSVGFTSDRLFEMGRLLATTMAMPLRVCSLPCSTVFRQSRCSPGGTWLQAQSKMSLGLVGPLTFLQLPRAPHHQSDPSYLTLSCGQQSAAAGSAAR